MIAMAAIMLLAILTYFFQSALDSQNDPRNLVIASTQTGDLVEMKLRADRQGHYALAGSINGVRANFILDTGATYVAIPEKLATRLHLEKGQRIPISTANGNTSGYRTVINRLTLGKIVLYDIKAVIQPRLDEILLGMSALRQLEFIHQSGELTIRQRK